MQTKLSFYYMLQRLFLWLLLATYLVSIPLAQAEDPPKYIGTFGSQGVVGGITDAVTDAQGNIYVLSGGNNRVIKFNKNNEVLAQWGGYGQQRADSKHDGTFGIPSAQGIALDAQGNVYVADTGMYRIQKFDSNGNFLAKILPDYHSSSYLIDVAVDASGKVYVVDQGRSVIRVYNTDYTSYTDWGTPGVSGNTNTTFFNPRSIAISGNYAYIADEGNKRVVKYDITTGQYVTHWGSYGSALGQFMGMKHIAVGANGRVYVAGNDAGINRIQSFNNDSSNPQQWSPPNSDSMEAFAIDNQGFFYIMAGSENSFINSGKLHQYDSAGMPQNVFIGYLSNQPGRMGQPVQDVALNSQGEVYVADAGRQIISKFSNTGEFLEYIATSGQTVGKVSNPSSLAIDDQDNLFIVDAANSRIQKWDGSTWVAWGSYGYTANPSLSLNTFYQPERVAVGGDYIYVTDTGNQRIKMMDKYTGAVLAITSLSSPKALAVDHAPPNDLTAIAHVYVVDSSGLVKKFRVILNGTVYTLNFVSSYNYNPATGGSPIGLSVYNHQLYIGFWSNASSGLIKKYDLSSNTLLTSWGAYGTRAGELNYPRGIAVAPLGKVYVANSSNRRVDIYSNQPSAPTNLTATLVGYSRINLSWTDNSNDETAFEIERCYGATGDGVPCTVFETLATVPANTTTYSDMPLPQAYSLYRYRVKAVKTGSSSDPSNIADVTVQGVAPANLIATATGSYRVNLQWLDSFNNETGYKVERCETLNCVYTEIASLGARTGQGATIIFNDSGSAALPLTHGNDYTYRVRAYRRINSTTTYYSEYAQATATTFTLPVIPSLNSLTAIATNKVNVQFTDNSTDETRFYLERCQGLSCTNFVNALAIAAKVGSGNAVTITNTITNATPNTPYSYRMRAQRVNSTLINGVKYSTTDYSYYSAIRTVTTLAPPEIPFNFLTNPTLVSGKPRVELTWIFMESPIPTSVRIERCTLDAQSNCSTTYSLVKTQAASITTYIHTSVTKGLSYHYRIKSIRGTESSDYAGDNVTIPN